MPQDSEPPNYEGGSDPGPKVIHITHRPHHMNFYRLLIFGRFLLCRPGNCLHSHFIIEDKRQQKFASYETDKGGD